MEKRQTERLLLAMEKIAISLEKIETTLDRGLINDVSGEAYLWDIYLAFHTNRDERFPNALTDIGNKLSTIAENLD